mgnify:CR=1 FL=1
MGTVGRVPVVLALAAVVLTGCAPSAAVSSLPSEQGRGSVVAMTPGPAAGTGTPPAATPSAAPVVPGRTPSSGIAVRRATQSPSDDARIPVRVDYPAIGATLSVVSVGVTEDGAMELPDDSSVGGWYRHGSAPGDPEGTAVIAAGLVLEGRAPDPARPARHQRHAPLRHRFISRHRPRQPRRDVEPQPAATDGAHPRGIGPPEAAEQFVHLPRLEADTMIPHRHGHGMQVIPHGDVNGTTFCIFNGIGQQIPQNTSHPNGVNFRGGSGEDVHS